MRQFSQVLSLLGAIFLWSAPALAEPSEPQMRSAMEGYFDTMNANYASMARQCRNGGARDNPMVAIQCLQICAASQNTCEIRATMTAFSKTRCEESGSAFRCWFRMSFRMDGSSGHFGPMNGITQMGDQGWGYFYREAGAWRFQPA